MMEHMIKLDVLIDYIDWDDDVERWTLRCEPEDIPAVEVVRGRWVKTNRYDEDSSVQCSQCLMEFDYIDGVCYLVEGKELPNYCPNCGVKMDGDNND